LHDMEQECVKLGKMEEFQKILSVLANKLRQRNAETSGAGDSVVVPPLSDLYYQ
jgi:hypothetical protein